MTGAYPELRQSLNRVVEELDEHLAAIHDDRLFNEVNQASKHAALARHRLDEIDAASPQLGQQ